MQKTQFLIRKISPTGKTPAQFRGVVRFNYESGETEEHGAWFALDRDRLQTTMRNWAAQYQKAPA